MPITENDLRTICDRKSLFVFLREKLHWPVDPEDTFTYEGPELHGEAAMRAEVSQIVPFGTDDPFTIMLVDFVTAFRRTDLREILRRIREDIRKRAKYEGQTMDEFVFACPTLDYKAVWLAHFEERAGRSPRLELFGWDQEHLHETRTLRLINLEALQMPERNALGEYDWGAGKARWLKAWDVRAVTHEFFRDYKAVYNQVSSLISQIPGDATGKQRVFTQRLMNRLLFVQFLSKRGWLRFKDRRDYLAALWASRDPAANFYNSRLRLLFLSGLNNSQCRDLRRNNPVLFSLIGEMPFLNGGLFEDAPEDKMTSDTPGAIVPNEAIEAIIGLFEKYNFTITESTPDDVEVAVDPEMLGEVFERLVTEDERKQSGSYYTPRSIVQFMCREALKGYLGGYEELVDERKADSIPRSQARDLIQKLLLARIADPACGSGAYLLGMLHELFDLIGLLEVRADPMTEADKYQRKLNLIQNNLYGVDLTGFAVETARLRLWLSLVVEDKRRPLEEDCDVALPNLDYKVEQGDSLTAPPPSQTENLLRHADVEMFKRLKREYLTAHGPDKRTRYDDLERLRTELRSGSHAGKEVSGFDWAVEFVEVFEQGGFDIVLANPPYGATVGDNVRDLYFNRRTNGPQSKDTYGLFVARAMQLLRPGGQFSFIISDTWRTIKSHKPLRRRLAQATTVRHVLDLPAWVFDSPTVNTNILTFTLAPPPAVHQLVAGDLRNIPVGDWNTLESNLRSAAAYGLDVQTTRYARYTYPQSLIGTYDNYSFFIGSPKLYGLMSDQRLTRLGSVGRAPHGISTGNNSKYVRKDPSVRGNLPIIEDWMKMSPDALQTLTEKEKTTGVDKNWTKLRGCFVPFEKGGESNAKGGWLPNYYVPTQYYINWAKGAITDMRRNSGVAWKNQQFFFKPGLTFSISGIYAPTFRLNSTGVFEAKGSGIFCNTIPPEVLLALLCSNVAKYQFKNYIKHSVDTSGDDIEQFRFPQPNDELILQLSTLVSSIVEKQKTEPRYPYHLYEQKEIDALVYTLYDLDADDIREVELWYCRRYPRLAQAQGVFDDVQQKYAEHLAHADSIMAKPPGYWKSHPRLANRFAPLI